MELIHLNLRIFHLCIFIELGSHSPNLLHIFPCCLKKGAYSFFLLADNCRYLVGYDDGSHGDSSWIVRHKLLSSRWRIPCLRGARSACCKYWLPRYCRYLAIVRCRLPSPFTSTRLYFFSLFGKRQVWHKNERGSRFPCNNSSAMR